MDIKIIKRDLKIENHCTLDSIGDNVSKIGKLISKEKFVRTAKPKQTHSKPNNPYMFSFIFEDFYSSQKFSKFEIFIFLNLLAFSLGSPS